MKELKVLAIVAVITGIIYWGVEPLAHGIMHPHVAPADYSYNEYPEVSGGDVAKGRELALANCTACHGLEKEGMQSPMGAADAAAAYGVVPPDLSTAGKIYNEKYLAAFIKNPVKASEVAHKFDQDYAGNGKMHPMPAYNWMPDSDIVSIVAYFKSIAPADMTDKEVFTDACSRCHNMKYTKDERTTPTENIEAYMGSNPPDLSMMIKSRGEHYLHTFINKPQKNLHGTAMPRVGLTEEAEKQVVHYMEKAGDPKKKEREEMGPKFLIYLAILAVLAYLWKRKIWSEVH